MCAALFIGSQASTRSFDDMVMLMETKRIISVSFLFRIFILLLADEKKCFHLKLYVLDKE